ncbi:M61 family metallopeptidase [Thalassotalea aquiviva]|uniref:M61 family metallopeptidase n=1 Tax=Thalassotalea aquiviva TaxID=3242415 RepID=UPI00352ABDD8
MSQIPDHIVYQIRPEKPNAHLYEVSIEIAEHAQQHLTLSLPAWLPGSYMIRDFAKNIVTFNVCDKNGKPIAYQKTDKQTWQLCTNGVAIIVRYQVYAFDTSVRTAYLDNQRGFFNGSSTFLCVEEFKHLPCKVNLLAPYDHSAWCIATGLTRATSTKIGEFGAYFADDYAHLIDCPVEMGNFDVISFNVYGIDHYLVLAGKNYADHERLKRDLTLLCQHHIDLFEQAPFSEYWFLTNVVESGFGGLEHKNSTALICSRSDLPNKNRPEQLSDGYKTFLSLCSHEYFHAWNVCRIKPAEFSTMDLSQEIHTTQLWAYEGITSYYDDYSLYRTGIITQEDYFELLSKTFTRVSRGQGELKQSLTESSFDTWTKFYKQGPDAVNNIVSYYTKGAMFALWLDLTIRQHSDHNYSLDNVMKLLWQHHGKTNIGTVEEDFISYANQLCQTDIRADFQQKIYQSERIDLTELLATQGITLSRVPYLDLNSPTSAKDDEAKPYLGCFYQQTPLGLKLTQVEENSPAEQAGLAVNDTIIAIDQIQLSHQSLTDLLTQVGVNTPLSCHYFRDNALIETRITPINDPKLAVRLSSDSSNLSRHWPTPTKVNN